LKNLGESAVATLTGERRAHLLEMRALTIDRQGNELLVGLTFEETDFYLDYGTARLEGRHTTSEEGNRYLALHDKHERARLAILGAEIQLRNDAPTRH
jgi:hypothetical protein